MSKLSFVALALAGAASVLSFGCGGPQVEIAGDPISQDEEALRQSRYNCHKDKLVDTPAPLRVARADSPRRLHFEAGQGSDASGTARLSHYLLTDDSGAVLTLAPDYYAGCGAASDNAAYVNFEPVPAGKHFVVQAVTVDLCNNQGLSAPLEVTTPPDFADTTGPTVSVPGNIRLSSFGGFFPGVAVLALDDTAVDRVEFKINGQTAPTASYGGIHAWSFAEGDRFWSYGGLQSGTTALIEATAFDVYGNATTVSGTIEVPTY